MIIRMKNKKKNYKSRSKRMKSKRKLEPKNIMKDKSK
jgi:hypothetical protein